MKRAKKKVPRLKGLTPTLKLRQQVRDLEEKLRYASTNYDGYLRHLADMRKAVSRETTRSDAAAQFVSALKNMLKVFDSPADKWDGS